MIVLLEIQHGHGRGNEFNERNDHAELTVI